jgi:uncharacterized protein (TIRG00374 family)
MNWARVLSAVGLSLALGLAGLAFVLWWRGGAVTLTALTALGPATLGLGFALLLLSHLAGALRLSLLALRLGTSLPLQRALRAYLLGVFSAAVTPGGGGHALAIGWVLRRHGMSGEAAWSVAIYPTLLDLLFFAWSLPIAFLVLGSGGQPEASTFRLATLVVAVCMLLLWYLLAFRLRWLASLTARVFLVRGLRRWHRRAVRFTTRLVQGVGHLSRMRPSTVLLLQVLTLVLHTSSFLILVVVANALGAQLAPATAVAVMLLVSVVANVVPTPGASGYMEAALALALTRDADPTRIAAAVVTWRAYSHYAALLVGPLLAGSLWQGVGDRGSDRGAGR